MWLSVGLVSSIFALVAFVAAVAAFIYSIKWTNQRRIIQEAPAHERLALAEVTLESFHVDTTNLTHAQQYDLAIRQLNHKSQRGFRVMVISILIIVVFGVVLLFAVLRGPTTPEKQTEPETPTAPQRELDRIDIAGVDFLNYEGDSIAPRLNVKFTNQGVRSAFVTKVNVNVKRAVKLVDALHLTGAGVPPSHEYKVILKPRVQPYQVVLPVSHGLKPDDFDRFTIQFEEEEWSTAKTIYLVDVEIVANSNEISYKSKDLLFVITALGVTFPDSAGVAEYVRRKKAIGEDVDLKALKATISDDKAAIMKASMIEAVRNPALDRLIESAKHSDLE